MDTLWILTEEKPKISVVEEILRLYCRDFDDIVTFSEQKQVIPVFKENKFQFYYIFTGAKLKNCSQIILKTVSGNSSFFDFLVFKQENCPNGTVEDNLIMAIEETKTNGEESRNTGIYQRASKFVYIEYYYNNIKKYMLYNEELENDETKCPANTIKFGTNIFLTLGIDIVGKETEKWFTKFNSIDELISFKDAMRKPPKNNVPIKITKFENRIEISGRLDKSKYIGKIAHDPSIGALSIISKALRYLGWSKDIVITKHNVTQEYINNTKGKNKFLYICKKLNLKLDNITLPENTSLPEAYWHYEKKSEKIASILLHILAENNGMRTIYQNHAGCERGYFITKDGRQVTIPKKDKNNNKLYIPDLVLHSPKYNEIILVEGKQLSTLQSGLKEIENYDSIELEYIKQEYPECRIYRQLSIFGGNLKQIPNQQVLLYLNKNGEMYFNDNLPVCINNFQEVNSYR